MKFTRRDFMKTAGGFVCASTLAELHRKLRLHMDETNDPAVEAFPKT